MHAAVEFLLAGAELDAHDPFKAAVFELLTELVAFLAGRQGGHDAVQEVDMGRQVGRGVPFYAANVRGGRNGGVFAGEVSRGVGIGRFRDVWIRDDIRVVQEYPEDLLGHVAHFSLPDAVRARVVDGGDEAGRLGLFWFRRIS